jgi:hypothetical protein
MIPMTGNQGVHSIVYLGCHPPIQIHVLKPVHLEIPEYMNVKITINDKPSNVMRVYSRYMEPGWHSIRLDFENFEPGIYRVYFTAKTNSGRHYTSYGDIFFGKSK